MRSNSLDERAESMKNIAAAVDQEYENACEHCFAKWSIALWRWSQYPGFTYQENLEAFFYLLERLLREGKIIFCPPDDPLCRLGIMWDASPDEVIGFLRAGWPTSAQDVNDSVINDYFYDLERCPATAWLGEDGKWHGS